MNPRFYLVVVIEKAFGKIISGITSIPKKNNKILSITRIS